MNPSTTPAATARIVYEPLAMPLEEAMRTQKAIRRLRPDPLDDGLVLHLLELALRAPTGANKQNWEFIVVKDPAVKARLGKLNRQALRVYARIERLPSPAAVEWQAQHFADIPVIVVACLSAVIPLWPPVATASLYGSIFPSVQNLLLAARAAGVGATLITLPLWSRFLARRALGLPWSIAPCAVVPLGWPQGRYGPTERRAVEEVVSLDRYGNRAFLAAH
nr:albonoursin synthase [uncultured bacterium]